MPRAKDRPLGRLRREQLRCGVFRDFGDGDTFKSVARRLSTSPRRVAEALDEPVAIVQKSLWRGVTADEIAGETGIPRPVVVFAIRTTFARKQRSVVRGRARLEARNRRLQAIARQRAASRPQVPHDEPPGLTFEDLFR